MTPPPALRPRSRPGSTRLRWLRHHHHRHFGLTDRHHASADRHRAGGRPQFTISVTRTVTPSTVPAGSGGQGTITVNPINGYFTPPADVQNDPGITFSCSSITPLVTIPPVCSFTYPNGHHPCPFRTGSATSTITINTFGPVIIGAAAHPRTFYALWLPVPMLGWWAWAQRRAESDREKPGACWLFL